MSLFDEELTEDSGTWGCIHCCRNKDKEDGKSFCGPCIAFLNGETDEDPLESNPPKSWFDIAQSYDQLNFYGPNEIRQLEENNG